MYDNKSDINKRKEKLESRKQFEDWSLNVMLKDCIPGMLKRDCYGSRYAIVEVQMMWEAWQASREKMK